MISFEDLLDISDPAYHQGPGELHDHDRHDRGGQLDLADVDRRLIALALDDIEDIDNRRKGKRRMDAEPTDEEIAFALLAQELQDMQAAYSLAAALDGDADLLAQMEQEERRARRDREIAQALDRGEPMPASLSGAASPYRPVTRRSPLSSGAQTPLWARFRSNGLTPVRSGARTPGTPIFGAASTRRPDTISIETPLWTPFRSNDQTPISSGARTPETSLYGAASTRRSYVDSITISAVLDGVHANVECTACGSRIRGPSMRAPCDHAYDAGCIADLFQAAMTDQSLFPPRCCGQEILLESVRHLLQDALVRRFSAKAVELRTLRRVYCPVPTCSRFLGAQTDAPSSLVCPACSTVVCSACTTAHVGGLTCAQSADAQPILELAREAGWQRCPGCRRFVELEMGCYHMTCFCRTQFCYVCAAPWKSCECPQWEEARLIQVAQERVAHEVGRLAFRPAAEPRQRARIFEVAEQLRVNHDCDHRSTRYMRGSFRCNNCRWQADQYILECNNCYTRICRRCKHNRLL